MSEPEVFYCDNYEEITGRPQDGTIRDGDATIQTKVVTGPDAAPVEQPAVAETA